MPGVGAVQSNGSRILVRGQAGPRPLSLGPGLEEPPFLNSTTTEWAGVPFEVHETLPLDEPLAATPLAGECHLRVVLEGAYELELLVDGRRTLRRGTPGTMSLHGGEGPRPLRVLGSARTLVARLDARWLGCLSDRGPVTDGIVALAASDPLARTLAHAMYLEVSRSAPSGALFAESLSQALLSYAAERLPASRLRVQGALSAAHCRALRRRVDERLSDRNLGLVELAALCGLKPRQFGALFRRAFGASPYQYVLARRLERAADLLGHGSCDIAEVADRVGFASQSHFTTAFRRAHGLTPGRYARARRTTVSVPRG